MHAKTADFGPREWQTLPLISPTTQLETWFRFFRHYVVKLAVVASIRLDSKDFVIEFMTKNREKKIIQWDASLCN